MFVILKARDGPKFLFLREQKQLDNKLAEFSDSNTGFSIVTYGGKKGLTSYLKQIKSKEK